MYNFDAQRCLAKRSRCRCSRRAFSVFRSYSALAIVHGPSTTSAKLPRHRCSIVHRYSVLPSRERARVLFATFQTRAVAKITSLQKDCEFYRDQRQNEGTDSRCLRALDTVGKRSRGPASLNNRTKNLIRFNSAMLKRPSRTPVPISVFTRHPCNFLTPQTVITGFFVEETLAVQSKRIFTNSDVFPFFLLFSPRGTVRRKDREQRLFIFANPARIITDKILRNNRYKMTGPKGGRIERENGGSSTLAATVSHKSPEVKEQRRSGRISHLALSGKDLFTKSR